jgi:hypothetical protein
MKAFLKLFLLEDFYKQIQRIDEGLSCEGTLYLTPLRSRAGKAHTRNCEGYILMG